MMDDIFQLARIAWPRVPADQYVNCLSAQHGIGQTETLSINFEKILRQGQHVARPLAQWRNVQGGNLEAVIKIFAETSCGNGILQIHVRCSHNANVNRNRTARTEPHDLTLLQDPEQLHLHGNRKVANFVEE